MTALPSVQAGWDVGATMARLYEAGFALIPLGGADGKKPLVREWPTRKRLPLATVFKIMKQHHTAMYGIRLDGLMVVDLDTHNDATDRYFSNRFEPSPVTVFTSRGSHHWFRHSGPAVKAVRQADIAIDFKSGNAAFVVGPGSTRPDNGFTYAAGIGDLASCTLPVFVDHQPVEQPDGQAAKTPVGTRHDALVKRAVQYAHCIDTYDELLGDLRALKELEFEEARTVEDSEIVAIAQWTWRKRLEGNLYAGRNSAVKFNRMAMDWLCSRPDGSDAALLYMVLLSNHGHHPGKLFAIVPDAMIKAGLLSIDRMRVYNARKVLLEGCLIRLVSRGRPDQFRLMSPLVADALREGRKGEGGLSITLVSPARHRAPTPMSSGGAM